MRSVVSRIYAGLAWVVLAAVAVQFFFAGLGVFGASDFEPHIMTGYLLVLASLILLLLAAAGRLGRFRIGHSAILLALTILQPVLANSPPIVAALHPVVAVAVLAVAGNLARRGAETGASSQAASPAPEVRERQL